MLNWKLKITVFILIGVEVFVMNTSYINMVVELGLIQKTSVFLVQAIFHSFIFYLVLKLFTTHKKDRLNLKRSLLFFILILFCGSFRVLISIFNLSSNETWVMYITHGYHFLRSPNVFAILIPLLIVRKRVTQGEI